MKLITKVKDVDDFGKAKISGNLYQYSHHYPRVEPQDFIIYYYPADNMMGIYQVTKETEAYSKDGFTYYEGEMLRSEKSIQEFVDSTKRHNLEAGKIFEKTILDLMKNYGR